MTIKEQRRSELKRWGIVIGTIALLTLNIAYGVRSAIRMVSDPIPSYNRMKVKIVDDGEVAFLFYDQRCPYKVGDMFTYVHRDADGNPDFEGPKLVVLELVQVSSEDTDVDARLPGKWLHKRGTLEHDTQSQKETQPKH